MTEKQEKIANQILEIERFLETQNAPTDLFEGLYKTIFLKPQGE